MRRHSDLKGDRRGRPSRPGGPWRYAGLVLVLAAALAAALSMRSAEAPESRRRIEPGSFRDHNVLFITLDTVRADYLGSYGSSSGWTPNLDRLAAEGIRFADFQSHVPLTLPAHASIFSARLPTAHGVHDNGSYRVDASLPTLATILSRAGYRTGAFVGAFVLDARFGLDRGFDVYDDYYGEKRGHLSFTQLERRADEVIAPAEAFITESDAAEPWLAWVHLFDAHAPYDPPAPFGERSPSDLYGAEVAYVDDRIGSFLRRLEERGALAETLVVIAGDHGESLGEHGERTHGAFAYRATLHVPWILWAARGIEPRVFPQTVAQVDVLPTVLDLLGLEPPADADGRSLLGYLNGEPYTGHPVYFEALNPHLTQDWAPLHGVIRDGYKLVRLPIPELYDLEKDPDETRNRIEAEPAIARGLGKELDRWLADADLAEPDAPDPETMRRLRSLGYVTAPVAERRREYSEADDPKRLIGLLNAYEEAKDLFAQGRTNESIALLEDLVRKRPGSSQGYQGLAYALHQTGRVAEAIAVLERAIENGVDDRSLLYLLSAYLLETNEIPRAAALLEDLVRRDPDYAEAHNYLGIAYGRMGRNEEARREFETVLELDPSSASTYNNLGSLALSEGDAERAVERFRQALRYDPELASAHNGLGVAHARGGDVPSAIDAWRRTVELNPRQFDALYNLAMALAERSPSEAIPYLERYAEQAPPHRYQADIDRVRAVLRDLRRASPRSSGS